MKYLRIWSFITALSVSASPILGASANWQALVTNPVTSELVPIDMPQGLPPSLESPILGTIAPLYPVIFPDAKRALVTGGATYPYPNIFVLDLTTTPFSIVGFTSLPVPPGSISISPDGSKVYTVDYIGDVWQLNPSDLSVLGTIPQSAFNVGTDTYIPNYIALSPNKPEAYITTGTTDNSTPGDKVFVINTDTNTVTSYFELLFGSNSYGLSVTPNGSELYVGNVSSNLIYYINLNNGTVQYIVGGDQMVATIGIAIAPDGSAVYAVQSIPSVFNTFHIPNAVTKIDTTTHKAAAYLPIPSEMNFPGFLTITPDGRTAIVLDLGTQYPLIPSPGQYVAFIDTTTGTSSTLQLSIDPYSMLVGVAVTPDQAPTARFTSTANGTTVAFDASASSSPIGGIATYEWDFGDGQTEKTAAPKISHNYANCGTFTVTLTVTNTGGTSTSVTYTGREVKNNGGPSARLSQQVSTGVIAEFKGKVHRHHKKKKVSLHTRWSKDTMPHTRKYVFYAHDSKITSVKSKHKRHKTLKLHPHHFPHKIKKGYRHYLDRKYNIRVVDAQGHVSQPTFVHVAKE